MSGLILWVLLFTPGAEAGPLPRDPAAKEQAALIERYGFELDKGGNLVYLKFGSRITAKALRERGIRTDEEGYLVRDSGALLNEEDLNEVLNSPLEIVPAPESFEPDEVLKEFLDEEGYAIDRRGTIREKKWWGGARITREMLKKARADYDEKGQLVYTDTDEYYWRRQRDALQKPGRWQFDRAGRQVPPNWLLSLLKGLVEFTEVEKYSAKDVGERLREWGVPPAYDGTHLLNPDGSATYFGVMLYHGWKKNPEFQRNSPLRAFSGRELSRVFSNFKNGYNYIFDDGYHVYGTRELRTGLDTLAGDSGDLEGERIRPTLERVRRTGELLAAVRREAASGVGDAAYQEDLRDAIAALNALEKQYHYPSMNLSTVPTPPAVKPVNHAELPKLLSTLDKVMGGGLSSMQKEALIKSFPMGESIWRMGAHKLWAKGLTGKGVKVAVIDTGVGHNPELDPYVKGRFDMSNRAPIAGEGSGGYHGTHVAGTIHAIAPDAEIRSYDMFDDAVMNLDEPEYRRKWGRLIKAIDRAVADGNTVVNISMSNKGGMGVDSDVVRVMERYAAQGIQIIATPGNQARSPLNPERPIGDYVRAPSISRGVMTVGNMTISGEMAGSSSFGGAWDPHEGEMRYKDIFMTPGTNIVSTTGTDGENNNFKNLSGTSMAGPHLSGASGLLMGHLQSLPGALNPMTFSSRLQAAFKETGRKMEFQESPVPLSRKELPKDNPKEDVYIVDPVAALDALPQYSQ